jgi:hypothetical protein
MYLEQVAMLHSEMVQHISINLIRAYWTDLHHKVNTFQLKDG